jgi:hypothetical protein
MHVPRLAIALLPDVVAEQSGVQSVMPELPVPSAVPVETEVARCVLVEVVVPKKGQSICAAPALVIVCSLAAAPPGA